MRESSYRSPIANTLSSHHDTDRLPEVLEEGSTPPITCSTVFGHTNESLQGVVTIEQAAVPQRSKYAGKISTQVLAKSAEELFQDRQIRIRVMGFFRPLMSFAEDIPVPSVEYYPIVDRPTADSYVEGMTRPTYHTFPLIRELNRIKRTLPVLTDFFQFFLRPSFGLCTRNFIALGSQLMPSLFAASIWCWLWGHDRTSHQQTRQDYLLLAGNYTPELFLCLTLPVSKLYFSWYASRDMLLVIC